MYTKLRYLALTALLTTSACGDDSTPSDEVGDVTLDAGGDDATAADAAPSDATDAGTDALGDADDVTTRDCAVDNGGCGPVEFFACVEGLCVSHTDLVRDVLLDGIELLDTVDALPSTLVVHGDNATPIVVDSAGRPIIAASIVGEGRVIVVAHEGVLGHDPAAGSGFGRFVLNAAAWLDNSLGAGSVGIWPGMDAVGETLASVGWETTTATTDELGSIDLLVMNSYDTLTDDEIEALHRWIERGGALLIGGQAWWWGYEHDDAPHNYPGNWVIAPAGVTITEQYADSGVYPLPARRARDIHHAGRAIDALLAHVDGSEPLDSDDLAAAAAAAGAAIDTLPLDWPFFGVAASLDEAVGPVVPSRESPVEVAGQPIVALAARLQVRRALDAPPDQIQAHPAAEVFPGSVASSAPRVTRTLTLSGNQDGPPAQFAYGAPGADVWRSTGLYAAPGDEVLVTVDEALVDTGVGVQIGAHTDELYGLEQWWRMPRVVRRELIRGETTHIANGFGGPIYITIPVGSRLGDFDVEIVGAVAMPVFDVGDGGLERWEETRTQAAPWAELAGANLVLTVPSEAVATLDGPDAVMALWDEVLEADADLAGIDRARPRAERFVVDQQISAGWMHSGYPIMAHLESSAKLTDIDGLLSVGAWGPVHELGHNHQNVDWVLPGTTESSVNIWSVYVSETVFGVDRAAAHDALTDSERTARIDAWQAGTDRDWSVWMALETYLQLQEEFGWEFFRTTFGNYLRLTAGERPADDAERLQQWIVMSSEAAGFDLSDFYDAWGLSADEATRTAVGRLPPWDSHPMR